MVAHAMPSNFTCSVLPSSPTYLATLLTIWLTYLLFTYHLPPPTAYLPLTSTHGVPHWERTRSARRCEQ